MRKYIFPSPSDDWCVCVYIYWVTNESSFRPHTCTPTEACLDFSSLQKRVATFLLKYFLVGSVCSSYVCLSVSWTPMLGRFLHIHSLIYTTYTYIMKNITSLKLMFSFCDSFWQKATDARTIWGLTDFSFWTEAIYYPVR